VDDNIRGYGCDGLTNCVDGVTWNWPNNKPPLQAVNRCLPMDNAPGRRDFLSR
jgi:hypothetical protein